LPLRLGSDESGELDFANDAMGQEAIRIAGIPLSGTCENRRHNEQRKEAARLWSTTAHVSQHLRKTELMDEGVRPKVALRRAASLATFCRNNFVGMGRRGCEWPPAPWRHWRNPVRRTSSIPAEAAKSRLSVHPARSSIRRGLQRMFRALSGVGWFADVTAKVKESNPNPESAVGGQRFNFNSMSRSIPF